MELFKGLNVQLQTFQLEMANINSLKLLFNKFKSEAQVTSLSFKEFQNELDFILNSFPEKLNTTEELILIAENSNLKEFKIVLSKYCTFPYSTILKAYITTLKLEKFDSNQKIEQSKNKKIVTEYMLAEPVKFMFDHKFVR